MKAGTRTSKPEINRGLRKDHMKKIFASTLMLATSLAAPMFAQGETDRMEIGVSAIGAFPSGSSGNGVQQGGSYSGGVLASYRYFFTAHQGAEADYGYTRDTLQYSTFSGSAGLPSNMHEFSASYVYRMPLGRFTPFASAGFGGVVFDPATGGSFAPVAPAAQGRPTFVYSVGADITITSHLSFRAQYRGLLYKAPDFGTGIGSDSAMNMSEPAGGLVWRF
jgi:opacity protein-like surface antigen